MSAKPAKRGGPEHPALILATCILASSLAFVDGSVVNVGLPALSREFGGKAADLQWVINAYTLPLSALLLLGGALGDRFGRRVLLILGVGLFALSSAGCGLAPSLPILLAARAAQGLGAALLLPSSLAILGAAFEGEARGKAVGAWAAISAMSSAIGPVLGGWLIDTVGWRSIFFLNLPLAAGAIALAVLFVRDSRKAEDRAHLDLSGAALATAALGAITWGLTVGAGPAGWTPPAVAAVAAGALFGGGFVWVEVRKGDRAMTPPALFGSRQLVGLNLLTLVLYGALGGLMVLLPYLLIETSGYAATKAGAALLPFPIIMTLAGPVTGAIAGRLGSKLPIAAGSAIVAVGFLLALRIGEKAQLWTQVLPCIAVFALGMSGVAAPLTTAVLSSVDGRHTGSASGLNSAVARMGGLIATALLGGVLATKGAALVGAFHVAAMIGAGAAALAGLIAALMVSGKPPKKA